MGNDELVNETGKYWNSRYEENRTGWDMGQASPPLKNYIDTLINKSIAILIPGCGNAYEAEYLLSKGFTNVTLIDIAPTLVNKLKQQFKGKPINVILGNFFEHTGKYDLMLEQTFFCALDPSLRKKYVEKSHSLLNTKGKIAGLLFGKIFEQEGPPFGGTKEEYELLFKPKFNFMQFDVCKTSIAPRMGNELFIEFEKKLDQRLIALK
ncbi:MAG TPA: methyltransferase domain-containing protein [Bacteroidia bacterium]|nr:methyltransferase domain-containing protein [Bacteroidia bacterium]